MTRIIFLVSLALLIGIALSLPSNSENAENKEKSSSNEKQSKVTKSSEKSDNSESREKQVESHKKHDKHKKSKSDEKQDRETHEKHEKRGDQDKNESHEKSSDHAVKSSSEKHKKHSGSVENDKHKKHNKHSSRSRKHHRKHSRRNKKNDTKNVIAANSDDEGWEYENTTAVDTRRILYSKTTQKGKRPYMVYLQLTKESAKAHKYRGWLCGGVIVERYYVLTSAACVEDADHFYVVSGTTKFVDSFDYRDDQCACNNRRKVVWKCIPKNYKFDFQDSIKWSSNDIAIVKVNKPFKFGVVEKGCEFATDLICYNNVSRDLEKPGTKGWIAGWGSGSNFREGVYRRQDLPHIPDNAKCLQEAKVCIMDNEQCAKKWSQRFRSIITQYMICTKDVMKRLSEICDKRYANCTDVETRRTGESGIDLGRHLRDPDDYTARRSNIQGGFCENDHGGPLIVRYQNKERVIGVISACKIDPKTHSCHGPFLYTSVFKNRQFISCSIYKDTEETCRRVFRTGITHEEWNVNWDGVREDDAKKDDDDDDDDDDDKEEDSDNSDSNSKETLRQAKDEPTSKAPEASKSESSSSSEETKEEESKKEEAVEKSKEKSAEISKEKSVEKSKEKSIEKSSKIKDSSKSQEKKSKEDMSTDESSSDSSSSSEEGKRVRRDNREVFYDSSRDENVNEPDSGE